MKIGSTVGQAGLMQVVMDCRLRGRVGGFVDTGEMVLNRMIDGRSRMMDGTCFCFGSRHFDLIPAEVERLDLILLC